MGVDLDVEFFRGEHFQGMPPPAITPEARAPRQEKL